MDEVERLIGGLRSPSGELRRPLDSPLSVVMHWMTVRALVKIGVPAAEPLCRMLGDADQSVRRGAAWALVKIGDTRAVEPLCRALEDKVYSVREQVVEALVSIGTPAVEPLYRALEDEYADVRKQAAEALVKIGAPAVEALCQALGDKDKDVRWRAAEALVKIGAPAMGLWCGSARRQWSRCVGRWGMRTETCAGGRRRHWVTSGTGMRWNRSENV